MATGSKIRGKFGEFSPNFHLIRSFEPVSRMDAVVPVQNKYYFRTFRSLVRASFEGEVLIPKTQTVRAQNIRPCELVLKPLFEAVIALSASKRGSKTNSQDRMFSALTVCVFGISTSPSKLARTKLRNVRKQCLFWTGTTASMWDTGSNDRITWKFGENYPNFPRILEMSSVFHKYDFSGKIWPGSVLILSMEVTKNE